MEIKKVQPKPYEKSISPGISFDVEIGYKKYEKAIIGISGWLETDDKKIIAEIREEVPEKAKHTEIGASGSRFDRILKDDVYKTTLVALLDRRALNHIEKRRREDRKRDVKLTLNLNVKTVDNRAVISHVYEVEPEKIGLKPAEIDAGKKLTFWSVLIYDYTSEYSSDKSNIWILSGNNGPVFLAISEQPLKDEIRIPSTDWIHDYAPKLELGEYFIVEIPKGKGAIEEAWSYVEKAEGCFRTWDTKGVFANCREAGDLLDKTISNRFKNSPTIKKWKRAIEKFNYSASLDLHVENIKEEKPEGGIKIGKAEAEHIIIITKALIKYAEELLGEE